MSVISVMERLEKWRRKKAREVEKEKRRKEREREKWRRGMNWQKSPQNFSLTGRLEVKRRRAERLWVFCWVFAVVVFVLFLIALRTSGR